jgi:hypothetical protein
MSKVSSGYLDWSRSIPTSIINIIRNLELGRIASQPVLSALSGNLEWNRINVHNYYFPADRWIYCSDGYERL